MQVSLLGDVVLPANRFLNFESRLKTSDRYLNLTLLSETERTKCRFQLVYSRKERPATYVTYNSWKILGNTETAFAIKLGLMAIQTNSDAPAHKDLFTSLNDSLVVVQQLGGLCRVAHFESIVIFRF